MPTELQQTYDSPVNQAVVAAVGKSPGRILDLGCGTGSNGRARVHPTVSTRQFPTLTDVHDLMEKTKRLSDDEYAALRQGAMKWARDNTTRRRAEEFLSALGISLPESGSP